MDTTWKTQVWSAFRARELTPLFRDVLLRLATFRGRRGLIFPSHQALADRARCCERTVRRALEAAKGLGLVRWCERRIKVGHWATERTSNLYTLIVENGGKPTDGQKHRVASPEDIPSLVLLRIHDPMARESREILARVAAERDRKRAQEWLAARTGLRRGTVTGFAES
jgi:hypothetical protein